MPDNKKYYYLKLKENFFDSDEIIVLESMQDGYLYSNILLKLYLRALKYEGRLMFNERIPYNPQILAKVTRHNVGVVEKALKIFIELGLVEILDNGAIYISDIQNFIGHSSTEADRKRKYRLQIEHEKGQMSGQISDKCTDKNPPEIELKKEIKINNKYVQEKNLERPAKKSEKNQKYLPLSEKLKQSIQKISPNAIIRDTQLSSWANDFRLMVEQDSRTYEFIDTLLEKVFKDEFWSKHIRSASKLRIRLNEGKLDNLNKPKFQQQNMFQNQPQPEYMRNIIGARK